MTGTNKSYLVAAIIIGALLASIFFFARAGLQARAEAAGGGAAHVETAVPTESKPGLVRGADNTSDAPNPRVRWVNRWRRQMALKGWSVQPSTSGRQNEVLILSWGRDRSSQDEEHMQKLKQAQGFLAQLRRLQFERLVMKLEGEPVWKKNL
jgi:hypothetical protein